MAATLCLPEPRHARRGRAQLRYQRCHVAVVRCRRRTRQGSVVRRTRGIAAALPLSQRRRFRLSLRAKRRNLPGTMNDVSEAVRTGHAAKPTIVRPRDAASLILLRGKDRDLELLAGRRPLHMKFMPGVYVFPGGAIDRDDGRLWRVESGGDHLPPRMLRCARAALRETWEETGVLVGRRCGITVPDAALTGIE